LSSAFDQRTTIKTADWGDPISGGDSRPDYDDGLTPELADILDSVEGQARRLGDNQH